ncbi:unnamed protein product [marine sediment metagenome]|uniref:Uncharacterized protein n=1 Tax=marine sediment metagenome TaxID=412755 RepID=X1S578_9ZZZZ
MLDTVKPGLLIAGLDLGIEFLEGGLTFIIKEAIDCHLQQLEMLGV